MLQTKDVVLQGYEESLPCEDDLLQDFVLQDRGDLLLSAPHVLFIDDLWLCAGGRRCCSQV